MTPKEKAFQIYNEFFRITESGLDYDDGRDKAKECALRCVAEILDVDMFGMDEGNFDTHIKYYENVAREIRAI